MSLTNEQLDASAERHMQVKVARSLEHNNRLFQQERERLSVGPTIWC